jgi:hypothetical protein
MARFGFRLTIGFIALGVATPIAAGQIDFEDLPASNDSQQTLRGEYAHLGVMFVATDDGATWSGGAGGDPGRWGLEGSSGATFLGFDGRSYAIALSFDAPVRSFGLEVARAQGAVPFFLDQFRLTGFLEGRLVETRAVLLGGVNEWKEIALEAEVDRVVWFGTGLPGHRFGVDGLRWDGVEPEVLDIEIDILPGSDRNPVVTSRPGVVPIVVYGEEHFPVEDIELESLRFGPGAASAQAHGSHVTDRDGDGTLDLLVHHRVREAEIHRDAVEACLYGVMVDGRAFEGCDAIHPVGR